MGLTRQEYWSELPCPPPGDLPDPGIKPGSLALQADSLPSEPSGKTLQPEFWSKDDMEPAHMIVNFEQKISLCFYRYLSF